jgi:oligopeptide transport system substrate-binding protein
MHRKESPTGGETMLKRTLALVLTVLVLATSFAGCGTTAGGAKGGTLNINLGGEPPEMDPQLSTDTNSFMLLNAIMEGLVRYDKDGGIMAGAADKWEVSADGLTYTFTIRKNNKWSNGDPVTAEDFVFGLQRALDPATASQYAYILYDIKNAMGVNDGSMTIDQLGVRADGDKVIIEVERPTPYFLSIMAFGTSMPANKKFFEENKENYGAEASSLLYNGPFIMKEWVHEDHILLEKNPNYWNKNAIALDQVMVYMIADSATSKVKFFNKELDITGVAGVDFAEFESKGYTLMDYPDGATFYLEFNTTDPLMSNKKIRQAFSFALDRGAYITQVMKDRSAPALAYVNPTMPGKEKSFREELGDLIKDNAPEEAKKLLDEGLAEVGVALADAKFSMILDEGDLNKTRGAALQDMWKRNLGVDVTIEQMPFKSRLQKMTDKDFQMVFAGWGPDYNDPMTFLDVFLTGGGNNHTYYSSEAFDKLINDAKVEVDEGKRMDMLYEAEKILLEDMPIAPVYFRQRTWTHQEGIEGVVRRAIGGDPDLYWTTKK